MKSSSYDFWFICGTQALYGDECIRQEEAHCKIMTEALNKDEAIVGNFVFKGAVLDSASITEVIMAA
ncbi:MAG: L-arabinose isomerase, partial [Clostridia bacterium]